MHHLTDSMAPYGYPTQIKLLHVVKEAPFSSPFVVYLVYVHSHVLRVHQNKTTKSVIYSEPFMHSRGSIHTHTHTERERETERENSS